MTCVQRHHVNLAVRQHGKTQHSNALICQFAAQNGGVPPKLFVLQVRGQFVVWDTDGSVRTSEPNK